MCPGPSHRRPFPATALDGSLGLGLTGPWVWTRAMSQPMSVGASSSFPNMRVLLSPYHGLLGRSGEGTRDTHENRGSHVSRCPNSHGFFLTHFPTLCLSHAVPLFGISLFFCGLSKPCLSFKAESKSHLPPNTIPDLPGPRDRLPPHSTWNLPEDWKDVLCLTGLTRAIQGAELQTILTLFPGVCGSFLFCTVRDLPI